EASNGRAAGGSWSLCGVGKLRMKQAYREAFLKAIDKAYPGWSGEAPTTKSSASGRTDRNVTSAVSGGPKPPRGTAHTGREPRQTPHAQSERQVSRVGDGRERPSQSDL